jgi:ATP-dependent RNA helicase RhlE
MLQRPRAKSTPMPISDGFKPTAQQTVADVKLEGSFNQLLPEIQKAISVEGYIQPTPIQEECIPHLLSKRDMIGSAQTGTGKTAAFTLPLLHHLSKQGQPTIKKKPRALILTPTRELAAQIGDCILNYGRFLKVRHTVIFGGVSQQKQVRALHNGVDILVATPGRLLDLMQQGHLALDEVKYFILDEVDRMLDMGFIHDIKKVLRSIPNERQTSFFSATMAPKMEALAQTMVSNPVRVSITPDKPTVERIAQKAHFVQRKDKDALLTEILKEPKAKRVVVFTQMKHVANRVVKKLEAKGISATAIHGNKSQSARTKSLDAFKNGEFKVLVATDVAARGLDVDGITHVINYDLPTESETYVHRIGRTARAGADGEAITLCTPEDRNALKTIERHMKKSIYVDRDHDFHCDQHAAPEKSAKPFKGNRNFHNNTQKKSGPPRRVRNFGNQRRKKTAYAG